ncbi:MAG TPA: RnfH family protein [Rhodanobacteraceae bacterium]|nr:RnfH family protein [Rhodanobacteraceae bacterium]
MAEPADRIRVEVVYAEPGQVWSRTLSLPAGATARQAVDASNLVSERPDVRAADDALGVFGRRVKPGQTLRDGDRVEVYRPLALDPMEARRQRARDAS